MNRKLMMSLVEDYLGVRPKIKNITVLDEEQWLEEGFLESETSVYDFFSREIFIKKGHKQDVLHEMIHAAGIYPEGLTEAIAQEIGEKNRIDVGIIAYKKDVDFIKKYLKEDLRDFARRTINLNCEEQFNHVKKLKEN